MIAYNREQLHHTDVQEATRSAWKRGCISEAEYRQAQAAYPSGLYTPNPFIRIGLFIATALVIAFTCGLLAFVLDISGGDSAIGVTLLFFAAACYGALELFVREKRHYRSGVDDALAWGAAGLALTGIVLIADLEGGQMSFYLLIVVLGTFFALRFLNLLMALAAFAGLIGFTFYALIYQAPNLLPFAVMLLAAGVYFAARKYAGARYYATMLQLLEMAALLVFYMAGNYFVAAETRSGMLRYAGDETGLPAGWLFWGLTVIIPLVYIYAGIRRKDKILLRCGLVLVAAIVFTIRYYHSVMPLEVAMVLGGGGMILLAWALTRYLKTPKHGFTQEADDEAETLKGLQIAESLVIAQTFREAPVEKGFEFGGGTSAGGGAGAEY